MIVNVVRVNVFMWKMKLNLYFCCIFFVRLGYTMGKVKENVFSNQ